MLNNAVVKYYCPYFMDGKYSDLEMYSSLLKPIRFIKSMRAGTSVCFVLNCIPSVQLKIGSQKEFDDWMSEKKKMVCSYAVFLRKIM